MNMKGIFPRVKTYLDIACFHNSRVMDIGSIFISQTSLCVRILRFLVKILSLEKYVVVARLKLFVDTLFQNSLYYLFHSFQRPHSSVKRKKKPTYTKRKEQISFSDSQPGSAGRRVPNIKSISVSC